MVNRKCLSGSVLFQTTSRSSGALQVERTLMKEAACGLAPHPLMYEALAATLSKKKTVGQPVRNRIQSFVARRTGKTFIS